MYFWWGAFFSNLLLVGSKKLLYFWWVHIVLLVGSNFSVYFWWVRIVLHLHSLHLHSFHLHSFHLQSFHLHSFHSHSFPLHSFPLHSFHLHSCHSHSFYLSLSSLRGSLHSPHRFFTCTLLAVASPFILLAPGIGTFPPLLHLHSSCTFHLHSFHLLPSPVWLFLSSLRGSLRSSLRFFRGPLARTHQKYDANPPKVH